MLSKTDVMISFVLILMWNITLAAIGWYESRKATDLERKLRADIEKRRARFIAARERRKANRLKSQ
jgi:hypothetical protein